MNWILKNISTIISIIAMGAIIANHRIALRKIYKEKRAAITALEIENKNLKMQVIELIGDPYSQRADSIRIKEMRKQMRDKYDDHHILYGKYIKSLNNNATLQKTIQELMGKINHEN